MLLRFLRDLSVVYSASQRAWDPRREVHPRGTGPGLAFLLPALMVLTLGVSPTMASDYLVDLNAPILKLSGDARSHEAYFEAWINLDTGGPGAPLSLAGLEYGSATLDAAKQWAARPEQQAALDILLKSDAGKPNVTFRKTFGLPYGSDDISIDMDSYGFAVYVENDLLSDVEFAYLTPMRQLILLLVADAHNRIDAGESEKAVDSLVAAARISRQLCNRYYKEEVRFGMNMLVDLVMEIRAFMWFYRDSLTVADYKDFAVELELLNIDEMTFPRAHELMGLQLIDLVFVERDLQPNQEVFAQSLAMYETRDNPLARFEAMARWRSLMPRHATYLETQHAVKDVAGDFRLRWRQGFYVAALQRDADIDTINPIKYAIPRAVYQGLTSLFPIRHQLATVINGVATSAGVAAYQKREGGQLVPGEAAKFAPLGLVQVQPAFVLSQSTLIDQRSLSGDKLRYVVITDRSEIKTQRVISFGVQTPFGPVTLYEGWPILYSLGFDEIDGEAKGHADREGMEGDFIFWPPVELMAKHP